MQNPIKDNRIISSHTYAVRNLSFLERFFPNDGSYPGFSCPMDEEEYEYMCRVACALIMYQVDTCPESEVWYFKNLVKDYKSGKDIILKHICKYNENFAKYLKNIKAI